MYGGVVFMDYSIYRKKDADTEEKFWAVRLAPHFVEECYDKLGDAIGAVLRNHRNAQAEVLNGIRRPEPDPKRPPEAA